MNIRQFLELIRVPSLAATVVPLLAGASLAIETGHFNTILWSVMFVAALFLQIGTNVFNEHGDFVNNTDRKASHGFAGIIVKGEATPGEVLAIAVVFYAMAGILAIPLILYRGFIILILGLIAAIVGIIYSEGPYPISMTPLGEVMVGLTMGLIEVSGSEIAACGHLTNGVYLISVPISLLVANVLNGNNIRDIIKDREAGRKTIAVLIGSKWAKALSISIIAFCYFWVFIVFRYTTRIHVFIVFITLPFTIWLLSILFKRGWKYGVEISSVIYLIYGIFLSIGLIA